MASGKKKLLVAGLLTAVAAGAFYTFSGSHSTTTAPPAPPTETMIYEQVDALDYIMAETKDDQVVHIYVDVPQLSNGGTISDAALAKDIRAQLRMGINQGMMQWNKAELAGNASSVENDLALFLGRNVTLGVGRDGNLIPAVEGVNFGAPKILKIVDAKTQQALYQAPTTGAPTIVAPAAPKPPGT